MTSLNSAVLAGREAFKRANLTQKDIDFAEVHDCFTIAELVAEEDLGFVPRGDAAKLTQEGYTSLKGELPVNPSGGLKAKGHPVGATGVGQVVRNIRATTWKSRRSAGGKCENWFDSQCWRDWWKLCCAHL